MRKIKVVVLLVRQLQHGFTKNAKVSPNLTLDNQQDVSPQVYITRRSLPRYRESIKRNVINGRITYRIVAWTDFPCELLAPVVRHSFIMAHSEKLIVRNSVPNITSTILPSESICSAFIPVSVARGALGLYREIAIAIQKESGDSNGGNV